MVMCEKWRVTCEALQARNEPCLGGDTVVTFGAPHNSGVGGTGPTGIAFRGGSMSEEGLKGNFWARCFSLRESPKAWASRTPGGRLPDPCCFLGTLLSFKAPVEVWIEGETGCSFKRNHPLKLREDKRRLNF